MTLLGRLPAAAFLVMGLILAAWFMQAVTVTPDQVGVFVGAKMVVLLQLVIVLLPYGALLLGLLAAIYLAVHHLEHAKAAGISMVALLVIYVAWKLWLGAWVTAHLAGAA